MSRRQSATNTAVRVDAASDTFAPEPAVLDRVVGSSDSCPVGVRLAQDGLLQPNVAAANARIRSQPDCDTGPVTPEPI
jgi:hypothetical protein